LPLQITEPVSCGKSRQIITYGFEWASAIRFLLRAPQGIGKATYWLEIKKIKYQQFNAKGRPFD
jgi:hypothetical protein